MNDKMTGNKNNTSDFMRVLMALKQNIMRDSHSTEVCQITTINTDTYIVVPINKPSFRLECIALQTLELQLKDVVLVTFADTDFRINLKRIKASQPIQDVETKELHSNNYGIITGLIYREEEENE